MRMSASPGAAVALSQMNYEIDIRGVLPVIRVPTLILHATGDLTTNVGASRFMAGQIPGAKLVELPSTDHLPWAADADLIVDEIEEFLTGERHVSEPDRILATILFVVCGLDDREVSGFVEMEDVGDQLKGSGYGDAIRSTSETSLRAVQKDEP